MSLQYYWDLDSHVSGVSLSWSLGEDTDIQGQSDASDSQTPLREWQEWPQVGQPTQSLNGDGAHGTANVTITLECGAGVTDTVTAWIDTVVVSLEGGTGYQ